MNDFENIKLGARESFTKTISESDVILFCQISGDFNPIHIDDEYASKTIFKKRIVHGMLVASFISTILGTKLPGLGTIYLYQDLKFIAPVFIGDTITATVEVISKDFQRKRIILNTFCTNQDLIKVINGQALVLFNPNEKVI